MLIPFPSVLMVMLAWWRVSESNTTKTTQIQFLSRKKPEIIFNFYYPTSNVLSETLERIQICFVLFSNIWLFFDWTWKTLQLTSTVGSRRLGTSAITTSCFGKLVLVWLANKSRHDDVLVKYIFFLDKVDKRWHAIKMIGI